MQLFAIFLVIPIVTISADITQDLMQYASVRNRCSDSFSVDPTTIERFRAGENVNDPTFNCYLACILQGMDFMQPNGRLNPNAAITKVPNGPFRDGLVQVINNCANQNGRDKCDTARLVANCLHKQGINGLLHA